MIGKSARYHRHSSLRPRAGQRPKSAFRQLIIQPVWRSYISSPRPKPRPFLPTIETTACVGLARPQAGNLRRVALLAASVLIGRAFAQRYSALVHLSRRPENPCSALNPLQSPESLLARFWL